MHCRDLRRGTGAASFERTLLTQSSVVECERDAQPGTYVTHKQHTVRSDAAV
ncbi:Protein of unknown function [Gryllus bimaculatus]|nr:Protein of unknown function [Gryllus bimaculatus]